MITGFTGSSRESSKWLSCDLVTSFVQSSTDCHIELSKIKDVRRNFISQYIFLYSATFIKVDETSDSIEVYLRT